MREPTLYDNGKLPPGATRVTTREPMYIIPPRTQRRWAQEWEQMKDEHRRRGR